MERLKLPSSSRLIVWHVKKIEIELLAFWGSLRPTLPKPLLLSRKLPLQSPLHGSIDYEKEVFPRTPNCTLRVNYFQNWSVIDFISIHPSTRVIGCVDVSQATFSDTCKVELFRGRGPPKVVHVEELWKIRAHSYLCWALWKHKTNTSWRLVVHLRSMSQLLPHRKDLFSCPFATFALTSNQWTRFARFSFLALVETRHVFGTISLQR